MIAVGWRIAGCSKRGLSATTAGSLPRAARPHDSRDRSRRTTDRCTLRKRRVVSPRARVFSAQTEPNLLSMSPATPRAAGFGGRVRFHHHWCARRSTGLRRRGSARASTVPSAEAADPLELSGALHVSCRALAAPARSDPRRQPSGGGRCERAGRRRVRAFAVRDRRARGGPGRGAAVPGAREAADCTGPITPTEAA
jgi:hypothetical protein